ncbi:nucleoside-diphosphate sugar epimerase [Shewanella sp. 1_MG-2023]|uniref:nucleoside-diphosphate sugar epimerase n=1 Tax=unclassified Shewanella TaxID=196818 RepID=UPI0026E2D1BB|nr:MULTISPECIES: nucleoside-diphosphate sugar epimerase [unclassified Shewanella]MDO6611508.1 nucleoside-diphosphate sugar epimerase [Shewanella sp. 7_MG-2023]MDO6771363.1 nucleoside-diphosphate sugar epimerase [Shewanella sp. 2_MG-2023]MDO6793589.1 nucleoside-diphosphate sugar epimerase [Shewanella sp. 1_MG-2023]
MNAAIIGATGLIGHYLLLNLLADARYQTVLAIGRRAPELAAETAGIEKLIFVETQLQQLTELNLPVSIDHAFCCLGTTIKQAGSQENFIKVDHTAVIDFAKLAIEYQSQTGVKLFVVTALDANEKSTVFYNRVKGQVQKDLSLLPLSKLYIFQPSLLLGERASQRTLEDIGQKFFAIASGIFIGPLAKYKPIAGKLVADNMLAVAIQDYELVTDADLDNDRKLDNVMVRIIDNKQMHRLVN